jgi:hypothetical protein
MGIPDRVMLARRAVDEAARPCFSSYGGAFRNGQIRKSGGRFTS